MVGEEEEGLVQNIGWPEEKTNKKEKKGRRRRRRRRVRWKRRRSIPILNIRNKGGG